MELEELLMATKPKKVTTEITKMEIADMEAKRISDLHDLINSLPDGVIISVEMEVLYHD